MKNYKQTPPEIQEGDLLAYLEGKALPEVARYINQSEILKTEAATLLKMDLLLTAALSREACPPAEALLVYAYQKQTGQVSHAIKTHLEVCSDCQEELAWLVETSQIGEKVTWLELLSQSWAGLEREVLAPFKERLLQAMPVLHPQTPALAWRGSQAAEHLYEVDDYQIVLALTPPLLSENTWDLEGQISRMNSMLLSKEPVNVYLWQNDQIIARDEVDEFGYFSLSQVPAGAYQVEFKLAATRIRIEKFEIA